MLKAVRNTVIAAMALGISAISVQAQSANCAPRQQVIDRLANKYGESRKSVGLSGQNMVVEMFASDETGSWSITVTRPDGLTCLVASGQFYEDLVENVSPKGSDA